MTPNWRTVRQLLGMLADVASLCSVALLLVGAIMVIMTAARGRPTRAAGVTAQRIPAAKAETVSRAEGRIRLDPGVSELSAGASVALIEFGDFQCPYCAAFERNVLPVIRREFIDSGSVAYAFKNFPLAAHPMAEQAGIAATCAAAQGKYWEMHRLLFSDPARLTLSGLVRSAGEVPLREPDFNSCLTGAAARTSIEADRRLGEALGVMVTPTFFVGLIGGDGTVDIKNMVVGAQSPTTFRALLLAARGSKADD